MTNTCYWSRGSPREVTREASAPSKCVPPRVRNCLVRGLTISCGLRKSPVEKMFGPEILLACAVVSFITRQIYTSAPDCDPSATIAIQLWRITCVSRNVCLGLYAARTQVANTAGNIIPKRMSKTGPGKAEKPAFFGGSATATRTIISRSDPRDTDPEGFSQAPPLRTPCRAKRNSLARPRNQLRPYFTFAVSPIESAPSSCKLLFLNTTQVQGPGYAIFDRPTA